MSKAARVESIEALKEFRAALCTFAEAAAEALADADWEVQRTVQWLKQDQPHHWRHELRRRSEQLALAKMALDRKRAYENSSVGNRASCIEEKKAFELARRRLEDAEKKSRAMRRWTPRLEQEAFTYQAAVGGMVGAVEVAVPNACARIDRMLAALEAYLKVAPVEAEPVSAEPERQGPLLPPPAPEAP